MTAATFRASLRRERRRIREVATRNYQDTAFRIGEDITRSSPVDTGRFKGNWNASIGTINSSADENRFDRRGFGTIQRLGAITAKLKIGQIFNFANSVLYARLLERGHSSQAPAGVVRTAIRRLIARAR